MFHACQLICEHPFVFHEFQLICKLPIIFFTHVSLFVKDPCCFVRVNWFVNIWFDYLFSSVYQLIQVITDNTLLWYLITDGLNPITFHFHIELGNHKNERSSFGPRNEWVSLHLKNESCSCSSIYMWALPHFTDTVN